MKKLLLIMGFLVTFVVAKSQTMNFANSGADQVTTLETAMVQFRDTLDYGDRGYSMNYPKNGLYNQIALDINRFAFTNYTYSDIANLFYYGVQGKDWYITTIGEWEARTGIMIHNHAYIKSTHAFREDFNQAHKAHWMRIVVIRIGNVEAAVLKDGCINYLMGVYVKQPETIAKEKMPQALDAAPMMAAAPVAEEAAPTGSVIDTVVMIYQYDTTIYVVYEPEEDDYTVYEEDDDYYYESQPQWYPPQQQGGWYATAQVYFPPQQQQQCGSCGDTYVTVNCNHEDNDDPVVDPEDGEPEDGGDPGIEGDDEDGEPEDGGDPDGDRPIIVDGDDPEDGNGPEDGGDGRLAEAIKLEQKFPDTDERSKDLKGENGKPFPGQSKADELKKLEQKKIEMAERQKEFEQRQKLDQKEKVYKNPPTVNRGGNQNKTYSGSGNRQRVVSKPVSRKIVAGPKRS